MANSAVKIEMVKEGSKQILVIKCEVPTGKKDLKPSASGKTLSVASTNGNIKTGITLNGAEITVGLNAYVKNPDYKGKE